MRIMTKKEWMEYLENTWDAARKEAWAEHLEREWVGLTKDECDGLFRAASDHIEYAYALEAKLKEKNT